MLWEDGKKNRFGYSAGISRRTSFDGDSVRTADEVSEGFGVECCRKPVLCELKECSFFDKAVSFLGCRCYKAADQGA